MIPKFGFESYERSTMKSTTDTVLSFQNAFKSEFNTYCTDRKLIRDNTLQLDEVEYFLSPDEVPDHYKNSFAKEHLPFVSETDFRILTVLKSEKYGRISVWEITPAAFTKRLHSEKFSDQEN